MSKQGVSKILSTKLGTSQRGVQFFHEKPEESIPLKDD